MDSTKGFDYYLEKTGEIGHVEEVGKTLVYVNGLPGAKLSEIVVFENGQIGQVMSLNEHAEIVLFSDSRIGAGKKAARTGEILTINVSDSILGTSTDPLLASSKVNSGGIRVVDADPPGIGVRRTINKPLRTGVAWSDLVVPIAKGQRELIIGDRKTGKTSFARSVMLAQAKEGTICIYANIGKRSSDIASLERFINKNGIKKNTVVVSSRSSDPSGLVFLTPYSAMTIAEYFRDAGRDVLVILDDMTTHARSYREISLLGKRFPGRNSYPGDIFNVHARVMERAGNFVIDGKEASITCLPIAQSVVGDLSGYIETNLMSMTDGHIFFDIEEFGKGRRPAINPFFSVTRVGHQAQSPMMRMLGREVVSFLVEVQKLEEFMHFGAELSEASRNRLELGDLIMSLFGQSASRVTSYEVNAVILASLWAGDFKGMSKDKVSQKISEVRSKYASGAKHKQRVDSLVATSKTFGELVRAMADNQDLIFSS